MEDVRIRRGALLCLLIIVLRIDGGIGSIFAIAQADSKGLVVDWGTFDLSSATGMSARYGNIGLGFNITYSQAVRRDLLNDELYGGFTVAYAW